MKRLLLTFLILFSSLVILNLGGPSGCGGDAQCGDGVIGSEEVCDGSELNGQTCDSQGFSSVGTLKCSADCQSFDTSDCVQPGTLQGLTLISGDASEWVELAPDPLGNFYVGIHSSSTTIEAGGESLTNTPPQPGVSHPAAAKINPDGSVAWLEGFEGNGTTGDNGVYLRFDASANIFFSGNYYGTTLVAPDRTLTNADATGATSDTYAGRLNTDGTIVWFDSFASDGNDQVFLHLDPSDRLYARGQFGGPTLTIDSQILTNGDASANTADMFLEQVNPADGTPVWITHFSSDSWDSLSPRFDSAGNIYVRGNFQGKILAINGTNALTNADAGGTTRDSFVGRFDTSTGSMQWITGFSSDGNDYLSVETDASGNVYAVGTFMGTMLTAGGQTLTNADAGGTTTDAFVAKINSADGTIAWLIPVSSDKNDLAHIATDSMGDLYVSGAFFGPTLTLGTESLSNADASGTTDDNFLGRLNPANGAVEWLNGFTGPGNNGGAFESFPAYADPTGQVYVTGAFSGATLTFGGQTLTNADPSGNTIDAFAAKFDADGTLAWAVHFSGSDEDSVALGLDPSWNLPSENIFVFGGFDSPTLSAGDQVLTNADPSGTTQDAFIGMLEPEDGAFAWIVPILNTGNDNATIVSDLEGMPYVNIWFDGPTIALQGQTFTNADASGNTMDVIVGRIAP